jgi:hypothetical protein
MNLCFADADDLTAQASALAIRNTSSAVAQVLGSAAGSFHFAFNRGLLRAVADMACLLPHQATSSRSGRTTVWSRATGWTRPPWWSREGAGSRGVTATSAELAMHMCVLLSFLGGAGCGGLKSVRKCARGSASGPGGRRGPVACSARRRR